MADAGSRTTNAPITADVAYFLAHRQVSGSRYEIVQVPAAAIAGLGVSRLLVVAELSEISGNLDYEARTGVEVVADGANNGIYRKNGGIGAGSWVKISDSGVVVLDGRVAAVEAALPVVTSNEEGGAEDDAGSGPTAYTTHLPDGYGAPATGTRLRWRCPQSNDADPTLNLRDGEGPRDLRDTAGRALAEGVLATNGSYDLEVLSAHLRIINADVLALNEAGAAVAAAAAETVRATAAETAIAGNATAALAAAAAAEANAAAAAAALIDTAIAADATRPGERLALWSAGTIGAPSALAPVTTGLVTTDGGAAVELVGDATLAPRGLIAISPGDRYLVEWAVRCTVDSTDPNDDATALALRWMDEAKADAGSAVATTLPALTVAAGRQARQVVISTVAGEGIDVVVPEGVAYARPYVQGFGSTKRVAVERVRAQDVTQWGVYIPDTGPLLAQIDAAVAAAEAAQEAAELAAPISRPSWAALAALTPNPAYEGRRAECLETDEEAEHADVVTGLMVPDRGVYNWSLDPVGWGWTGEIVTVDEAAIDAKVAEAVAEVPVAKRGPSGDMIWRDKATGNIGMRLRRGGELDSLTTNRMQGQLAGLAWATSVKRGAGGNLIIRDPATGNIGAALLRGGRWLTRTSVAMQAELDYHKRLIDDGHGMRVRGDYSLKRTMTCQADYGQSNAIGTSTGPVVGDLATPLPYAWMPARGLGLLTRTHAYDEEETWLPPVLFAEVSNNQTCVAASIRMFAQMYQEEFGQPFEASGRTFFGATPGYGGATPPELSAGGTVPPNGDSPFEWVRDMMTVVRPWALSQGHTYGMQALGWRQGEASHGVSGGSPANIPVAMATRRAQMITLHDDLYAARREATGETDQLAIIMALNAASNWYLWNTPAINVPHVAMADAALCEEFEQFICACPTYWVAMNADRLHMPAISHAHIGAHMGRCRYLLTMRGTKFRPLVLKREGVHVDGDVVVLPFRVPVRPLVIDDATVSDPGNFGFEAHIGGNLAGDKRTISSVEIVGGDHIKLIVPGIDPLSDRLTFARSPGAVVNGQARGCIRDSDPAIYDPDGLALPLRNWLVPFDFYFAA